MFPHNIKVRRGLDPGLDENAVKAVQQWRFEPAKENGRPVTVGATVVVQFRLN